MISFTATGDSLILDHFPANYPAFDALKAHLSRGDVRITNMEAVLSDEPMFGNTFSGGGFITAPSAVLDDLQALDFNFYSCANNHSMDFGHPGLRHTMANMKKRGLLYAGIGESLTLASQPAYVQSPQGRIALLSVAALYEHQDGSRADDSHDGMLPRPGVNVLRRNCFIRVTDEQFKTYQEIAEMAGAYQTSDGGYCIDNRHTILPAKEGEPIGRYTTANQVDMKRILDQIEASKHLAQMSVVCIHAHANKLIESYINETDPDYYLEEFVHKAIDAGADAVVGSGCHRLRGIEIYKGKPIFYSLGNFIFSVYIARGRQPADHVVGKDIPFMTPGATVFANSVNYDATLNANPVYYHSVLPYWEMENGKITKLEMLPIELNMSDVPGLKGYPAPCDPFLVLEDLRKASAEYGTEFFVNDKGLIEVKL